MLFFYPVELQYLACYDGCAGYHEQNSKTNHVLDPAYRGDPFVLFISLIALDIFEMDLTLGETIVGLFVHLIPTFLLIITTVLAWRWEWIGAVIFAGWAILYFATAHGYLWSVYALIAGSPLVIGILYLLDWIYRKQIRAA